MKYTMKVVIVDPETPEGMNSELRFNLTCVFAKEDEPYYGNGYYLGIEGQGFYGQCYDLRYDNDFNSKKMPQYLVDWAYNYWSGKDGAYKVKSIQIEEA